jgi:putative transposase
MLHEINAIYVPVKEYKNDVPFKGAHRIVGIDREKRIIALFCLGKKSNAPFNFCLNTFEQLVDDKKLQLGTLPPLGYMLKTNLNDAERAIYDSRKELIAPFLDPKNDRWIFDDTYRGKLVTQQMKKLNRPRKAVLRWIYHYLKYGMILGSLNCGFSRRGGFGKRKSAGKKKRGRPTNAVLTGHDESKTGINITGEICKLFQTFKDIYYNIKNGQGLAFVLRRVIEAMFSTIAIGENGETKYIPMANAPTARQLYYWHKKDGDALAELQNREGSRKFNLNHRGLGGRAAQNCNGPTDKYELDSTVLDLYCLSSFNRGWIIGRPILYFVVDTYSRMIVGFHLALSGPNWNEARIALFNAFSNKVEFCAKAGIQITEKDWPCEYLSQTVLVDRAEMRAHKPNGLIVGLGVDVDLAPPFRGDFKSVVERRFRIINDLAIKWMPGAVRARGLERGERDYRLDAALTLEDVKKVIIRCVLYHNNHTEYPDLLTRQMINDGIAPTPLAMWNWGLENAMGSPRKENPRNIYCHLLRKGTATVKADGIEWNGNRYTCDSEIAENWRAKARNSGRWTIPIRWLPDSTNHIWYHDEREGSFEQCDILNSDARYADIRVDECIDAIAYQKLEASDRATAHMGSAIDDDKFFESIITNSMNLKKAAVKGMSKQQQLADISYKRLIERTLSLYPSLINNSELFKTLSYSASDTLNEDDQDRRDAIADLISSTQG